MILQNSSRTQFYKKFLFKKDIFWSDKNTFVSKEVLQDENKLPVLDRMQLQLDRAGLETTSFTKNQI